MMCTTGCLARTTVYRPFEDILDALDSYLSCYQAILINRLPNAIGENDSGKVENIKSTLRNAHVVSWQ